MHCIYLTSPKLLNTASSPADEMIVLYEQSLRDSAVHSLSIHSIADAVLSDEHSLLSVLKNFINYLDINNNLIHVLL